MVRKRERSDIGERYLLYNYYNCTRSSLLYGCLSAFLVFSLFDDVLYLWELVFLCFFLSFIVLLIVTSSKLTYYFPLQLNFLSWNFAMVVLEIYKVFNYDSSYVPLFNYLISSTYLFIVSFFSPPFYYIYFLIILIFFSLTFLFLIFSFYPSFLYLYII